MEQNWRTDRSRELREQARGEIARMRDLHSQMNRALSRQRAAELGEDAEVRVPPEPTDPEREYS